MIILAIGAILIVVGAISVSFPELCAALKNNDEAQWKQLGSPYGNTFTHKTAGVFTWVLARGYAESSSEEVVVLGKKARTKALVSKYILLTGVALVCSGFAVALINA